MKKPIGLPITVGCATVLMLHTAVAQEEAPTPTPVVEIFGCTFIEGSDMEDLTAVATRWSAWADDNEITNYTAFILTPYLYSDQLTYDVLWLGAWPNGAAMGAGEAVWFAEGGDVADDFDAVVDCSIHALFAEVMLRQPEAPPPEGALVTFEDCKVQDGRTVTEAVTAVLEWTNYLAENGTDHFSAAFFPLAGESDEAGYDFKRVQGFSSIQDYGEFVDINTRGGYERHEELFSRLLTCDSPRVYVGDLVRLAAP
jgi:hypothetical protein